ncbi:hypothetical protein [Geobacillus stearothermophilus]|uniref:hypothetical protein n=1 Tax=Geobacillus stearothermophilus TaxID=1422 RepID=UPI0024028756|nr:hypothetical protein [Geobacillus stearothermophilus]MDF9298384.1 hypothetical protein [Geobacillus stearothermophilus]
MKKSSTTFGEEPYTLKKSFLFHKFIKTYDNGNGMALAKRWDGYGHPMKEHERWMLDETAVRHFNRTKSNEAF